MDHAAFGDALATGVEDVRTGEAAVDALDGGGFWAVVATFEGAVTAVRFGSVVRGPLAPSALTWEGLTGPWRSSIDEAAYLEAVEEVRRRVAAGTVYQVNICRILSRELPESADLDALSAVLRAGNPAPYAARIRVAAAGLDLVSASPESYLERDGERIVSRPIKGTSRPGEPMLDKDVAENVMITDLVRNDLSPVCEPGTVDVEVLCGLDPHPGLDHLVSTVAGRLRPGVRWRDIVASTFPPGSVSGAPKHTALAAIRDLEPVPRGPYCGAVGWVDADRRRAELAVGIRTFWAQRDDAGRRMLHFGTGAGITWGSDPLAEWRETELKAARLVGLTGRPYEEDR